jgi:endonuclease/exonuclease/phosphatase family metal-dependent hydrolase
MSIVLASYNIHRCIGMDGRYDIARVAEVIRSLQADVIALQEVEFPLGGPGVDLLDLIAYETGLVPIAGPTLYSHTGHYGNALLTRAEVLAVRRFNLAQVGREPRGALDVDLRIHGVRFQIVATHLGLRPFERRNQIQRILTLFHAGRNQPAALLGDFNEWFPWGRPVRWMHRYFGKPPAPATFPAFLPVLSLDRVWVHPLRALRRIQAVTVQPARQASDHLPVRAEVEWDRNAELAPQRSNRRSVAELRDT